jgi:acyl dehydratase
MAAIELKPGSSASLVRVFTQEDFDDFAALSGDDNPIHVDPVFSAHTRFGRTVAHGMLLISVLSGLVQRCFEERALLVEQDVIFRVPTFTGEQVRFHIEIETVDEGTEDGNQSTPGTRVTLRQTVSRQDGEPGLEGTATLTLLPGDYGPAGFIDNSAIKEFTVPNYDEDSCPAYKGLGIGQSASISRTFTAEDYQKYTALTGDPGLADLEKAPLPVGMTGSLFSYLLGAVLPGPGTNWLKQKLRFLAPAFPGEELEASVRIVRLRPEKDLVNLVTLCRSGSQLICEGEALVLVKDLEEK